jgi:hypothetical protein
MDGDSANLDKNFQSSWTAPSDQFRDLIRHIRPMVTVSHPSDKELPGVIEILDDDDDDGDEVAFAPSNPRKRAAPSPCESPTQRPRVNDTPVPFSLPAARPNGNAIVQTPSTGQTMKCENGRETDLMASPAPRAVNPRQNPFAGTPFEKHARLGKGFIDLAGIRSFITNHTRAGIPSLVNHKAYDELCMLAVYPWKQPLEVFIDQTTVMLRHQLDAILDKNLGHYKQTELYKAAESYLHEFLDERVVEQRKSLEELYRLETYKTFTVNRASINEHEATELQSLKLIRKSVRAICYVERQMRLDQKRKLPSGLTS